MPLKKCIDDVSKFKINEHIGNDFDYSTPIYNKNYDKFIRNYRNQLLEEDEDTIFYDLEDIVMVIRGMKPLAMVENDYELDINDKTSKFYDEEFENYNRYVLLFHRLGDTCGLFHHVINKGSDATRLVFYEENWMNACIMIMYHENCFSKDIHNYIDKMFDEFQGVLLGYSLVNIVNHNKFNGKNQKPLLIVMELNNKLEKTKDPKEKNKISEEIYKMNYVAFHENYIPIKERYQRAVKLINNIKNILKDKTEKGDFSYYNFTCGSVHKNQKLKLSNDFKYI